MEPNHEPSLKIDSEDLCSICLSEFTVPRTLPCLHSFCHECLQLHITESYDVSMDTFRCPLCRGSNRPLASSSLSPTSWADYYPINIYLGRTCTNHNTSTDGVCFCHDVHLCIHCLFEQHRNCCISVNPYACAEFLAYFMEFLDSISLWESRVIEIGNKIDDLLAGDFGYLEFRICLKTAKVAIMSDLMNIARQTLESDTIKLRSADFRLAEYYLTSCLKPDHFAEFQMAKKLLTQSAEPLIEHKMFADDKLIIGLVNEAKIFLISPLGECIYEMEFLGQIKSIDIWGEDVVIVLLKPFPSNLEGSCLQYLRCSDNCLTSSGSYNLDRSYSQIVAFSETKVVASYYDTSWVIDVFKVEKNTVVKVDSCVLGSDLCSSLRVYYSTYIIYTNALEIFCVNLEDKSEVCLLPKVRIQRNSIARISHLATGKYDIYFADITSSFIYKMTRSSNVITLFLCEKNGCENMVDFQFNSVGHVLTCSEIPGGLRYRLYNGEDFIGWNEPPDDMNNDEI